MKAAWVNIMGLLALWVSVSATAGLSPRAERPILEASLEERNPSASAAEAYPKPYHLFLNQKEGAKEPTSFTLHEDTGIRCISAPCPSDRQARFKIRRIIPLKDGSLRYIAREIGEGGSRARSLQVSDHRFSQTGSEPENLWEVRLTSLDNEREFGGTPQPVPFID